ncbi:HD domain-containing protein [Bremerella cremea]|uniref:Metal-dependent phosphohydrolase n=1 Tax=Blastopirellula marina TaxID=124 RepID=A0A2S8FYZ6_9BACT|nr:MULTISPECIES: HD domain-containing phosphohydrolase [Pirellulaceae]PQO37419.1 metal-dependent phosphohydrolase [Blastopirellula marina]RCS49806.1 HD domain-containing protein [Bremerella cremea]
MSTATDVASQRRNFLPVPLHTLCLTGTLPVDIYLGQEKESAPVLFRRRHIDIAGDELSTLLESGIETVYVPREQAEDYQNHLQNNVVSIIANHDLPLTDRLQFLGDTGRSMLREVFQGGQLDETIKQVGELSTYMSTIISENEVVVSELFDVLRHDYHTYTHVYNVASYSLLLAKGLGVSDEKELRDISMGGLLHDLGKLRIPLRILNKKERLTDTEWAIIQRHPTDGFIDLAVRDDMTEAQLMMVYQHHEKLDGSGYPVGIGGNELHFYAKVCAVVDIFEALTSNRPYRNPATKNEAMEILEGLTPNKLDQEMVQCWKALTIQ